MTMIQNAKQSLPGWKPVSIYRLLLMICLAVFALACGEGDGNQSNTVDSTATFALESVELGIGFDEPVLVDGSPLLIQEAETAEVTLEAESDENFFGGTLQAVDRAGNATDFRLEVTVGEGVL